MTKKPGVPEQDFSGTIAGGDLEGTGFKIGDEVYGALPVRLHFLQWSSRLTQAHLGGQRADAGRHRRSCRIHSRSLEPPRQYQLLARALVMLPCDLTVDSKQARKPESLSFAQAAAIPLTAITAHITLVKRGNAQPGDRVLINGGTSGVGVFAIQMAKAIGCHVAATCSGASFDTVKDLGADEIIDYKDGKLTENLSGKYGSDECKFDLIFDVSHAALLLLTAYGTKKIVPFDLSDYRST